MANPTFQVGDLVLHLSTKHYSSPTRMTVHAFTDEKGEKMVDVPGDWVFCKWYVSQDRGFMKELFHVKELQKV